MSIVIRMEEPQGLETLDECAKFNYTHNALVLTHPIRDSLKYGCLTN